MSGDFLVSGVFATLANWIWRTSWQAAAVALLVLILRGLFGRAMTRRWKHALWALVLLRLILPITASSRMSIFAATEFLRSRFVSKNVLSQSGNSAASANPSAQKGTLHVSVEYGPIPAKATAGRGEPIGNHAVPDVWQHLAPIAYTTWLAGMIFLAGRLVIVNLNFSRRLKRASKSLDPSLNSALAGCCLEMGIRRSPLLLLTDAVTAPAVSGVFRGRLLMPIALAQSLSPDQLRLVFLHELAHIKCFDVAIDWFWAALQSAHWFNPVFWVIDRFRRSDREQARDEMVLSVAGAGIASRYGSTILELAQLGRQRRLCPGLIGIVSGKKDLQRRITMIADFTAQRRGLRWPGLLLLALAGCAALTNPPAKQPPESSQPAAAAKEVATTQPAVVAAQPAPVGPVEFYTGDAPESPEDAAVREALDRRVDYVNFNGTSFTDVIDFFRSVSGINIYVDWASLERAGIKKDAPINARFRGIKLSKAMELVFKDVEVESKDGRLEYVIDEGVVTISTRSEMNKNVVTERYDVNDLLFIPPDYANTPVPTELGRPTTQPGHEQSRAARIEEIKKYISDNVATNTWKVNGGDVGTINSAPQRAVLLITQTPENHRKIRYVLNSLRESTSTQISVESRFFSLDEIAWAKLSDDMRQRLSAAARGGKDSASNAMTTDQVNEIVRAVQKSKLSGELTAPRLTLFSGQRASIVVSTSQSYIAGMKTIVKRTGESVSTTYEPQTATTTAEGVQLDLMATVSPDGRSVYVDFHPVLTRLDRLDSEPWPDAPPEAKVSIQRPIVSTYDMRTVCEIADGSSLVLGSFAKSNLADSAPASDSSQPSEFHTLMNGRFYVLLKPTIIRQDRSVTEPGRSSPHTSAR